LNEGRIMVKIVYREEKTELVTCQVCKGKGTTGEGIFRKPCVNCSGTGKIRR